jgi:copper chaperone
MTTTTYLVSGMTCGHCVSAVAEEIGKLEGVTGVEVDVNAGGDSRVTITSTEPLPATAVADAVDEAGYDLVGASPAEVSQ